jgi:uncharacterized protein (DUF305 family)
MKNTLSGRVVGTLAAAFLSLAAVQAMAQATMAKPPGMTASGAPSAQHGSDAMSQSMMRGMMSMQDMKLSGDTDKDFAMMMKMHHQQALDMAQMELDHGKSPEMKAMARKIIAAQKKEIAEFEQWMKKHP